VAITSAANNGEIEQAKVALKGTQNAQVKQFANLMIKEHGEAEAKGKKIAQAAKITPTDNDISTKLKSESESTLAKLKSEKGTELDKSYMDAQVKAHREVLSTIDDKLLPNVKNAELKTHLTDVRQHVSMHLTKAQEISAGLVGTASTPAKH
jgi:putative membrane protein